MTSEADELVVAACQLGWRLDDPDRTGELIGALDRAAELGARLIVAPELYGTGSSLTTPAESIALAEPADGPLLTAVREWSRRHGGVVVLGWAERHDGGGLPYNSIAVIDHGELVGHGRKTHLWDREKLLFTPGDRLADICATSVGRLGLAICYDLEIPEVTRALARGGAQILVAPSNWPLLPRPETQWPIEIAKAQAAAATNGVYVVVADRWGDDRGDRWTGGSVIVDRTGYLLAGPSLGREAVLTARIRPAATEDKKLGERNDAFTDLRPELHPPRA